MLAVEYRPTENEPIQYQVREEGEKMAIKLRERRTTIAGKEERDRWVIVEGRDVVKKEAR